MSNIHSDSIQKKKNQHSNIQSGCFPICQHVSCIITASGAHMLECIGSISLKREALRNPVKILLNWERQNLRWVRRGKTLPCFGSVPFCVAFAAQNKTWSLAHWMLWNRLFCESRLWLARWKSSERVYYSTQLLHCVPKHEKNSMSQALFMM